MFKGTPASALLEARICGLDLVKIEQRKLNNLYLINQRFTFIFTHLLSIRCINIVKLASKGYE